MPPTRLLAGLALLATAAAAVLGLVVAPPDAVQGQAQRLMYLHVPAAWTGYLAFAGVLVASVGYLASRRLGWDRWSQACAEVGVVATALAIVAGSVWGRLTWGVWWTWDARLVTTVVLLLVYVGQLGVRGLGGDAHAAARRAAVVGVLGFADVPVVHFSVLWWRTLHQPPTLLAPSTAPPIAPVMLAALLTALLAATLLGAWAVVRRAQALSAGDAVPAEPAGEPAVPTLVVRAAR